MKHEKQYGEHQPHDSLGFVLRFALENLTTNSLVV